MCYDCAPFVAQADRPPLADNAATPSAAPKSAHVRTRAAGDRTENARRSRARNASTTRSTKRTLPLKLRVTRPANEPKNRRSCSQPEAGPGRAHFFAPRCQEPPALAQLGLLSRRGPGSAIPTLAPRSQTPGQRRGSTASRADELSVELVDYTQGPELAPPLRRAVSGCCTADRSFADVEILLG